MPPGKLEYWYDDKSTGIYTKTGYQRRIWVVRVRDWKSECWDNGRNEIDR